MIEQEVREMKGKVRRLETQLAERDAELARRSGGERGVDLDRVRSSQHQSERLLEARETSHRQQVNRLENQVPFSLTTFKLYSWTLKYHLIVWLPCISDPATA